MSFERLIHKNENKIEDEGTQQKKKERRRCIVRRERYLHKENVSRKTSVILKN